MRMHQEELDSDGKTEHLTETVMRLTHPHGKTETELVSVIEDGKDVTAKKRAEASARKAKHAGEKDDGKHEGQGFEAINPFNQESIPKYRYWVVGPLPAPGRPVRIHFEPNGEATKEQMKGEANVDPLTGAVLEADLHPAAPPALLDHLDIQAHLSAPSAGGPMLSSFSVDGAGHLLFFHKHIRFSAEFDYAPASTTSAK
jgi:hypothetical protein